VSEVAGDMHEPLREMTAVEQVFTKLGFGDRLDEPVPVPSTGGTIPLRHFLDAYKDAAEREKVSALFEEFNGMSPDHPYYGGTGRFIINALAERLPPPATNPGNPQ